MSLQWVIQPKHWWLDENQIYNMVLLILLGVSIIFSLECLVQWMMLRYYVFLVCTKKPSIIDLFCLNFDEQGINWWQRLPFASMVDDSKRQLGNVQHTIMEALYNKHIGWGRNIVKNAFGILNFKFLKIIFKNL
jgi:hypothetical protein